MQKDTRHPQATFLLAQIAKHSKAYQQAMNLFAQASMLMPQAFEPLIQLAELLVDLRRYEDAEACFLRAIEKFPNSDQCLFRYAGFLLAKGEVLSAKSYLEQSLAINSHHCGALLALTNIKQKDVDASWLENLKVTFSFIQSGLADESNRQSKSLIEILHALALTCHQLKNYDLAFKYWQQANQLQLELCDFKTQEMASLYQQLKQSYNKSDSRLKDNTELKPVVSPIFIVGMPRSGSTLLEQMLTAHPNISTAGEADYLPGLITTIERLTGKAYPLRVQELNQTQLSVIAEEYLVQMQNHSTHEGFVIDKLPSNFQSVGLIAKLFPTALVIDLRRDPTAVGFSIYRNFFAENEPYFCDLNEFADYYQLYLQLMNYWQSQFPQILHRLDYAELVTEPKLSLVEILSKLGLDWHENCLSFNQQKSYVSTLSNQQVRQSLYSDADQQWQHYKSYLSPLLERFSE